MWARGFFAAVVTMLVVAPSAQAATQDVVARQVAETVARQIPGATIQGSAEEPLVGVPGFADLVAGRAEVMMDPAFWTQVTSNLLVSQTIVLPKPVDLVKPEAALPTVEVAAGGRPVWPLPRRDVRGLDATTYTWQGRTKTLREFVTSTETDGVAFLHQGRIAGDLYANGWSADVRHQPWSVTKSFVSALVGIAHDEGRVRSLADPIESYIPELRGTAWEKTTIRNLLEMESGVHWDEGTPVLAINTQVQQWVQAALDLVTEGQLGQTRNEFLKALPRVAPQGTKFSYNSGNTQVLAWMLERLYGKPFNAVISEKLWKPVGMAGDARVMTDRVGDAIASQGLYSRIFDLARFGELFRQGGRTPDGRQIVSRAWVRESTTMSALSKGDYAYQWWFAGLPGSFEASGFQGQKISVAPAECVTGVRLSHTLGAKLQNGFEVEMGGAEWTEVYKAVAKRLGGCPPGSGAATAGRGLPLALGGPRRMSRRMALRRGALRVRVGRRSERTALTLTAVTRPGVKVAERRFALRGGRARTVSVPLTRRGRALLRSRPAVRLTVRGVAVAGGRSARAARAVVLR